MAVDDWVDNPVRAWISIALAGVFTLVAGSLLFPRRVYDEFVWQYFWGPVVADAHGVGTSGCAVRSEGGVDIHATASACTDAAGVVAHPGYTTVSTVSYAIVLLFAIIGVMFLVQRLDVGSDRSLFFALVPFVFLGGTLRVLEDANAELYVSTGEMLISLPWTGLIISPLIYFFVFFLATAALVLSLRLQARDVIDRYDRALAAIGSVAVLGTLGALGYLFVTRDIMSLSPMAAIITLGGATAIAVGMWVVTTRYWPEVNTGTGLMGPVIVWGHSVDGIANVISLDWADTLGLAQSYQPKHVINAAITDVTAAIQPAGVTEAIGSAWPFLPVKVAVAIFVVWAFNDEIFEDSPNFALLMLVAILAVGLGPGTRDLIRATIGI